MRRIVPLFAMVLVFGAAIAAAQRDFSNVQIKTTKVADGVFVLEGSGGNIGVSVGEDGILMIDDQFAPLAEKIREALRKLGGDKPRFILNTHWHSDHVGGNEAFGRDGTIIAHDNVRMRLARREELFGQPVEPLPKAALPVITFHQTLTLHFNGEEIRMVHMPNGHTDGDSVIHFPKAKVIHMGDLMFAGAFPFVDLDHGGDVEGMARNVATVMEQAPAGTKFIPGHGPLSNLEDLKKYHEMLVETTKLVRNKMTSGKSLDQIKAEGVPSKWESWGQGFIKTDRWLETIYRSISEK